MNPVALIIQVIIGIILVAPVLWLSGRALVGSKKAKFTDAIWIVALGTVISVALGNLAGTFISALITLVVWLALIKKFFDCGWLKALAVAIVAVVIFVVIVAVLAFVGLGVLRLLL